MSEVRVRVWRVEPRRVEPGLPSQFLLIFLDENQELLPMTIGPCEAMAIESVVSRRSAKRRPEMTHDLLGEFITRLGGRLVKVVIDDLWNKVYYAKLHIAVDGQAVTVDARPSDAVAVALRMEAPLYATESVMAAASEADSPLDVEESGGFSAESDDV